MHVTKLTLSRFFIFNIECLSSPVVILAVDAGKKVARYKMQMRKYMSCGIFNLITYKDRIVQNSNIFQVAA